MRKGSLKHRSTQSHPRTGTTTTASRTQNSSERASHHQPNYHSICIWVVTSQYLTHSYAQTISIYPPFGPHRTNSLKLAHHIRVVTVPYIHEVCRKTVGHSNYTPRYVQRKAAGHRSTPEAAKPLRKCSLCIKRVSASEHRNQMHKHLQTHTLIHNTRTHTHTPWCGIHFITPISHISNLGDATRRRWRWLETTRPSPFVLLPPIQTSKRGAQDNCEFI